MISIVTLVDLFRYAEKTGKPLVVELGLTKIAKSLHRHGFLEIGSSQSELVRAGIAGGEEIINEKTRVIYLFPRDFIGSSDQLGLSRFPKMAAVLVFRANLPTTL